MRPGLVFMIAPGAVIDGPPIPEPSIVKLPPPVWLSAAARDGEGPPCPHSNAPVTSRVWPAGAVIAPVPSSDRLTIELSTVVETSVRSPAVITSDPFSTWSAVGTGAAAVTSTVMPLRQAISPDVGGALSLQFVRVAHTPLSAPVYVSHTGAAAAVALITPSTITVAQLAAAPRIQLRTF